MTWLHPDWLEARRRRFTRPDAARYLRAGADRPAAAGAAETLPHARKGSAAPADAELAEQRITLATLRLDWQLLKLAVLARKAGFDPSQPRDDRGRWTDTGAGDREPASGSGNGDGSLEVSAQRRAGGIARQLWGLTARQFVSRYCEGRINRELPRQFEDMTIADIIELAKGGDAAARKCYKILNEPRFRKK